MQLDDLEVELGGVLQVALFHDIGNGFVDRLVELLLRFVLIWKDVLDKGVE